MWKINKFIFLETRMIKQYVRWVTPVCIFCPNFSFLFQLQRVSIPAFYIPLMFSSFVLPWNSPEMFTTKNYVSFTINTTKQSKWYLTNSGSFPVSLPENLARTYCIKGRPSKIRSLSFLRPSQPSQPSLQPSLWHHFFPVFHHHRGTNKYRLGTTMLISYHSVHAVRVRS